MKDKRRPSLWWLAAAPLLFVLGTGGGTAFLVWSLINGLNSGETFLVPSTRTFVLSQPGTYVLSHDFIVTFDGKAYNKPKSLPDQTEIRLEHEGKELPMRFTWLEGSTTTSDTHRKIELGRYNVDEPGEYTLFVTGLSEDRVFSFGRSTIKAIFWSTLACVVLNLLGWLGAPFIVVIVLVLRCR